MLSRRKHSKIAENNFPKKLRLFSDFGVYRDEEVTLVVVWVGGGFISKWSRHFLKDPYIFQTGGTVCSNPRLVVEAAEITTVPVCTFVVMTAISQFVLYQSRLRICVLKSLLTTNSGNPSNAIVPTPSSFPR